MCGIFGVVSGRQPIQLDRKRAVEATNLLAHRGPDAFGNWGVPGQVELMHRRLAILDLSEASNQPFLSADGRYAVTFNGEIYNYLELRDQLSRLGHEFRTSGDTEVLLAAYAFWGSACVDRFNGDWAFAIYDCVERRLFCSRDRFGVKPFNYAVVDGQFAFASEIRSIAHYFPSTRRPNLNVIGNYCRNGLGAQSEETWFEGVKRLRPGFNLFWDTSGLRVERYWQYPNAILRLSDREAAEEYRRRFISAVKLRLRSDVPVGTTLSSGLDSGSIVATVRRLVADEHHTFTASFESGEFWRSEKAVYRSNIEIDEAKSVRRLAQELNLNSHIIECDASDFVGQLRRVVRHLESGHSSPATIPLHQIMEVARKYVTVLLEGQGADELLAGYVLNMFPAHVLQLLRARDVMSAITEVSAFRQHYSVTYAVKMYVRLLNSRRIERAYHRAAGVESVFGPLLRNYDRIPDSPEDLPEFEDEFTAALARAHAGGLVNLLHYGDALSMASSLESRLPFMDVDLVEFAFQLPFDLKIRGGLGKYVHRLAMAGIVPESMRWDPIKFGFNTPLARQFASGSEPVSLLLSDRCLSRGSFDERGIRQALADHESGRRDNSTFLFRCLSTELWWRYFMDQDELDESAEE